MSDDSLLWKALLAKSRQSSKREQYSSWKQRSNILGLLFKKQILKDRFSLTDDEVKRILELIGESNE